MSPLIESQELTQNPGLNNLISKMVIILSFLIFLDIIAASIGLKFLELWKYLTDNQQNLSSEEQGELICKVHIYYIGSYIEV